MKPLNRARIHFFGLAAAVAALLVTGYGATLAPETAEAGPLRRAGRFVGRVVSAPVRVVRNRQPVRTFIRYRQPFRRLLPRNWGVRAYGACGAAECSDGSCSVNTETVGDQLMRDDLREPVAP